jgi:hypothetical protein
MAHTETKELKDSHWVKIKQQETEVKPITMALRASQPKAIKKTSQPT